jgi:RNA recognition motif-containing protein
MEKKLFIGGLSYDTTEDTLKEVFSAAGFVEMSSEEEAKKAIETLNNKEVDGRNITVAEARPKEDRPQGGFKRNFNRGDRRGGFGGRRDNNW